MLLGRPSAYCLPDGTLQFFFCGSDNHIILTGPDGGRTDLSKGVNSTPPNAKGTPAPQMISGQLHIFYRDQNDHISDLWGGTPTPAFWQDLHDVIVKQGGQPPPLAISDPFAMGYPADGSKQLQVYYLGANNHICRFSNNYGDKWVFTALTARGRLPYANARCRRALRRECGQHTRILSRRARSHFPTMV